MAFLYFPNGAFMKAWTPTESGTNYELPYSLTPFGADQERRGGGERSGQALQP